jgi:hypothetical protein
LFWVEADTSEAFVLNTTTLARRDLFPALRTPFRPDGDLLLNKFGSSLTTFNTCTLSATCPTFTALSPALTTGGDFQIDKVLHRVFYVDLDFPAFVYASPLTAWNAQIFLSLPISYSTAGLLGVMGGNLYGYAYPVTTTSPLAFWRASIAQATATASILSTQIPGNNFLQVAATSTTIFLFTSTNVILQFPPNGSGMSTPATYYTPGVPGALAADENFVYWTDPSIGNVYRCPVAACTGPQVEIIATGQTGDANLVQDATALYWQVSGLQDQNQIVRLAK